MQILRLSIIGTCSLLVLLSWGCNHYSTANPTTDISSYPKILEKAKKDHRNIVMQSGINFYTMTSFDMDKAKKEMTVTLKKVDSIRIVNLKNAEMNVRQMDNNSNPNVHVIMNDSSSYTLDEPHTIPLSKIARIARIN